MFNKAIFTFLTSIISSTAFTQRGNSHALQMSCVESKLTWSGGSFKLLITNNTSDTFLIPNKIFSGVINSGLNFGYEVRYINELNSDTTDLTKNLWEDIHYAAAIPWNSKTNLYTLLPGDQRILNEDADELDKKGTYLVRFTMKQVYLHRNGIDSLVNLKSEWIKIYKENNSPTSGSKAFLSAQPASGILKQ